MNWGNVVSKSMTIAFYLAELIAGIETVNACSNQVDIIECGIVECGELLTESRNDNFHPTHNCTRDPQPEDEGVDYSKMGRQ